MSVVGFIDNNGEAIRFEEMRKGAGNFDPLPRPVLRALSRQYRGDDHYGEGATVSVTTLVGPIQITRLKERHESFVEPIANLWAAFGTIGHGMFEAEVSGGDIVEHKLCVVRNGVRIGGTFDLLELNKQDIGPDGKPPFVYAGKDYKITSSYAVKKMLNGEVAWNGEKYDYFWQGNIYKWLATQPDVQQIIEVPDAGELLHGRTKMVKQIIDWPHRGAIIDSWDLVTICRDFNRRSGFPSPINVIPIEPLLANDRIENYINERLMMYLATDAVADADLPQCSPAENWSGRRCDAYCEVAKFCHQLHPNLGPSGDV